MFNPFDAAKRAAEDAGKAIVDASQNVAGAAGEAWEGASNAVGGAVDAAGQAVGDAAGAVGGAAGAAVDAVSGVADAAGHAVGDAANAVGGAAEAAGHAVGDAANAVGGAVDVAGHVVGDAANAVGGAVNVVTGTVAQTAVSTRECVEAVVGAVGGAAGSVFGLMGKVGGSVAGLFCPELRTSAIEKVVRAAGAEPEVKVARDEFLIASLKPKWPWNKRKLVARGPHRADFTDDEIAFAAREAITDEAAGAPRLTSEDGARMISEGEWARFYVHVLRIIQKLCFLYGWREVFEFEGDGLSRGTFRLVVLMIDQMRPEPLATETLEDIAKGYTSMSAREVGTHLNGKNVGKVVDAVCDSINFGMNLESYYQAFALGNGEQPESLGYLDFWAMAERLRSCLAGTVLARGESAQPEWARQRLERHDWGLTLAGLSYMAGSPSGGEAMQRYYANQYVLDRGRD